jgi:predicted transcriptional regulator of viral defense system
MATFEPITDLIREHQGVISVFEAKQAGISRAQLARLAADGTIERIARGQYVLPDSLPDELYVWQLRTEALVYSHETALFLLDMADRAPITHSVTIPSTAKLSATFPVELKVYYAKPELYGLGLTMLPSKQGHEVRAYNAERTVCDIIRSRSRIDSQTVTTAIRNFASYAGKDMGRLARYAEAFRITKIMRTYLEVLL